MKNWLIPLVLLVILMAVGICYAQPFLQPDVKADVVYCSADGAQLKFDIYKPHMVNAPLPAVLLVHGGGWSSGSKQDLAEMATGLARLGYCAVSIDYRLAPKARFPAPLCDVKEAIRYLRSHASELNIDANRIGVIGGSAGAHLALLVACTDAQADHVRPASREAPPLVKAAISIAGPTDLTKEFPPQALAVVEGLLGKPRTSDMTSFSKASPIYYVNSNAAPMLLVHGDADDIVPYSQAEEMFARAKQAGATVEFVTIHGGTHAGGGNKKDSDNSVKTMVDFLARYLK